ncbi:MAG: hypothetical protein J6T16_07095, partial [Opitutales bacterium]|nr:hypothetical protein [Opitutales bacterium]
MKYLMRGDKINSAFFCVRAVDLQPVYAVIDKRNVFYYLREESFYHKTQLFVRAKKSQGYMPYIKDCGMDKKFADFGCGRKKKSF